MLYLCSTKTLQMDIKLIRHYVEHDVLQIWYKGHCLGGQNLFNFNVNTGVRTEYTEEKRQQLVEEAINGVITGNPLPNFAPRYDKLKKKGIL